MKKIFAKNGFTSAMVVGYIAHKFFLRKCCLIQNFKFMSSLYITLLIHIKN
jgi:hypothetical protein